jgi:hypothetical protein
MDRLNLSNDQKILALGDGLAIFFAVLVGFQNHETVSIFWQRYSFTFFPWLLGWFLTAPLLGLFEIENIINNLQIGKIVYAMSLATPMAAVLRAAWLGSSALPLFALIMGLASGLAIIIWRLIYRQFIFGRNEA